MKVFSCLIGLLLLAPSVRAADLAKLQAKALENREVIQRYVTNLEKSKKDVTIARGGYYPSVDVSYTLNSLDEDTSTEHDENSTALGKVSWNVFSGFKDKYNLASAKQLQTVETYRFDGIQQDIQLKVALAYLSVYDRRANLKVAEAAFKTLEKIYRDGEHRYSVGLIGKNELLKFRVDYDNADITVKAAAAGLAKSVNNLSREIGGPVSLDELEFSEFTVLPKDLDETGYEKKMLAGRSEIKALEGLIASSDEQVKAAYGEYYPSVDLVGSYKQYDDDYINGTGNATEDELRAQVVVSMNLFSGFAKRAATSKAKLTAHGLRQDLKELKDDFSNTLKNLFIDYRVSLENVAVALRSIEQAQENLRITEIKYEEGLEQESDLLDAITNLSRAKYNHVAANRTVFSNYFQLTRMVSGF